MKVRANDVRIPPAARQALARHEQVVVLSHDRPSFVIVHPDDYPTTAVSHRQGRSLGEVIKMLSTAPPPDPAFADDLEFVQASIGPVPIDPWESS
ncbi:MAG: hypothetical protein ACREP9_11985 [Candidatus Dormibacteraceae bacterium]